MPTKKNEPEVRADLSAKRERRPKSEVAEYRYVGGLDRVYVRIEGTEYDVAHGASVFAKPGVLDENPEWAKVEGDA